MTLPLKADIFCYSVAAASCLLFASQRSLIGYVDLTVSTCLINLVSADFTRVASIKPNAEGTLQSLLVQEFSAACFSSSGE